MREYLVSVLRSPGKRGPFDEMTVMLDGKVVEIYRWHWYASSAMTPSRRETQKFRDEATARAAGEAIVAEATKKKWTIPANWPEGPAAPPASYFPFREPGAVGEGGPAKEIQFLLDGTKVAVKSWTFTAQDHRKGETIKNIEYKTEVAAKREIDKRVAAVVANGWLEATNWPWPPAGAQRVANTTKPAKPKPVAIKRSKRRVPLDKLIVRGRTKRADASTVVAAPKDYVALLAKHGARMFSGRLGFFAPESTRKQTKSFLKFWTADKREEAWPNFTEVVRDIDSMSIIGRTIGGDHIAAVDGAFVVIPRDEDLLSTFDGLPSLFGWALDCNDDAGDDVIPTYAPGEFAGK